MPVAVRNKEKGPTVFSIPHKNVALEWAGREDPTGNDIQWVPDDLLDDVEFIRALNRDIFEVVDATDEVKDKLARQGLTYRERRDAGEARLESVMDRASERPIIVATVDEKGKQSNVDTTPRDPSEIRVNITEDPNIYGDEPEGTFPAGPVVQMDEAGRPLEREPQLRSEMGPRERE